MCDTHVPQEIIAGLKGLRCLMQRQRQEEDRRTLCYGGAPVGMRQRCSHKQLREKENVCNTKNGTKKKVWVKKEKETTVLEQS